MASRTPSGGGGTIDTAGDRYHTVRADPKCEPDQERRGQVREHQAHQPVQGGVVADRFGLDDVPPVFRVDALHPTVPGKLRLVPRVRTTARKRRTRRCPTPTDPLSPPPSPLPVCSIQPIDRTMARTHQARIAEPLVPEAESEVEDDHRRLAVRDHRAPVMVFVPRQHEVNGEQPTGRNDATHNRHTDAGTNRIDFIFSSRPIFRTGELFCFPCPCYQLSMGYQEASLPQNVWILRKENAFDTRLAGGRYFDYATTTYTTYSTAIILTKKFIDRLDLE